jgi:hypothetical protein
MATERISITPQNMTVRDAGGGVAFSTDYKYIKTDPAGNMRLTPVAASPINYAYGSWAPGSQSQIIIESHSGVTMLSALGDRTQGMDLYAPYAFPADGNLILGPIPRFLYTVGNPAGPSEGNNTDPASQPIFATAYSGGRYIGTIRLTTHPIFNPSSGQQQGIGWTAYMRSSESYYNDTGIIHSVPVYRGEKLRLYRSGPLNFASYTVIERGALRFFFNSGTSTIGLRVTA